jgi:outer membrane lipoprotein-sorting protein
MKKSFISVFLCIGLFVFLSSRSPAQTVDDVLKKMIESQGGAEFLRSVKDITITGSIDIVQQGLSGSLTIYKKEPDKRRTDIEVMGMIITQAYDGQNAWWVNPQTGATEELSGQQAADLKRQAMPVTATLDPAKYGLSFSLKGKEPVEGKEYFILEETFPDGLKIVQFVDPNTYLIHRVRLTTIGPAGTEVKVEQVFSDFKKEGKMTMAHSIVTTQDGAEYTRITFNQVKLNTGLEDSLFLMSKSE